MQIPNINTFNFVRRVLEDRRTPILHALLAAKVFPGNPSCREALETRTEAARTPWCCIDEKLLHFLPFYEEKCKNNVIFYRCCLHDTYLFLLWFLRADFVADVVGKYCWILLKMTLVFPQSSRDDYSWNLNCTWLFTGKINIFSKILNFGWAVKSCPFSFWNI